MDLFLGIIDSTILLHIIAFGRCPDVRLRSESCNVQTDDQVKDAGMTEEMLKDWVMEVSSVVAGVTVVDPNYFYPISDEIKDLIDSWLMEVHVAKMNEDLAELVKSMGLEGNYAWNIDSWVISIDPSEVLRGDAEKVGIHPETQDDWVERLLLVLDEKLNEAE